MLYVTTIENIPTMKCFESPVVHWYFMMVRWSDLLCKGPDTKYAF